MTWILIATLTLFTVPATALSSSACSVGQELNPGESCTVGSDRFEVLENGSGRLGNVTAGAGILVDDFSARRISGTDTWRILTVP